MRDITQDQFRAKCKEYGFTPIGFMGYYKVTESLNVSVLNAGPKRRSQLAYLIQQRDKEIAKEDRTRNQAAKGLV